MDDATFSLIEKSTQSSTYDPEKKVAAVAAYSICGSVQQVAELTGIPERTLRDWRQTEWFRAALAEARRTSNDSLDVKLTQAIDLAIDALIDRINNGDEWLDRFGNQRKLQVRSRDLAVSLGIMSDKRALLRGEPTVIAAQSEGQLDLIADKLRASLQQSRIPQIRDVIDVIPSQVIPPGGQISEEEKVASSPAHSAETPKSA